MVPIYSRDAPFLAGSALMSDNLSVALTTQQRDLLLEGLRFVRSARRYEFRDPRLPADAAREQDLRDIAGLISRLDASAARPVVSDA